MVRRRDAVKTGLRARQPSSLRKLTSSIAARRGSPELGDAHLGVELARCRRLDVAQSHASDQRQAESAGKLQGLVVGIAFEQAEM